MEKKYELVMDDTIDVDGRTLYRIKALRSFSNVKEGDLGGYIEKEDNLSHEGYCWVYDNARVSGNAVVSGNAQVSDNAQVFSDAQVSDNAQVFGNARVLDYARVLGNSQVFGYSRVCGHAGVFDNAHVFGDVQVFDNAHVSDDAHVFGYARVYGNAHVFDYARVYDNTRVYGNAILCGGYTAMIGMSAIGENADISKPTDYITIGPIGSRSGYTTFYKDRNGNIHVCCGCFNGTIDEFEKAVLETHKDNELYKRQYLSALYYAKVTLA